MFVHDATRYALFLPWLRKEHFAELGSKWKISAFWGLPIAVSVGACRRIVCLVAGRQADTFDFCADVKRDACEVLLENNAQAANSGAGQHLFTIDACSQNVDTANIWTTTVKTPF